jgi:galactokinase/galacturonokinase
VKKGAQCWEKGDIESYGKLVFESGYSSIYNFETGSDELKEIYNIMTETKGIYGGRFSGAGFKGCCMAIINPEYKEHIKEEITRRYLEKFPQYEDTFGVYFCKSENGVGIK